MRPYRKGEPPDSGDFICNGCGHTDDANVNAAIKHFKAGHAGCLPSEW